jgi:tRNA modification GTPase
LLYGYIKEPATGELVDEVMVAYMQAPHSYTREDVVEISCHGGPMPVQRVLQLLLREGARLAQPGEFTLRAFLNGRLDLAQAEAVLDIVKSRTAASLRQAVLGLAGRLSQPVKEVRSQIMAVLAYLTARIDFPEDEVEKQETLNPEEVLQKAHP